MSIVPFDPVLIKTIRKVLSVAETDKAEWNPSSVYVYADDNRFDPPHKQITLSIGFTEGGGNLKVVLQRYIQEGGKLAEKFKPYMLLLGSRSVPSKASDKEFIDMLKEAGKEEVMKKVQEECFDELYLEKAFIWAQSKAFVLPLSYLVIADSYLHSGSMLPFLMSKFEEKKPVDGGNEKIWIKDYLTTRKRWLATHSNKILNKTVYRAECYLIELEKGNWELGMGSIVMNGTAVHIV